MPRSSASSTDTRRIAVNTLANGTSRTVTIVSSFVFLPLLVRSFGLADYGIYMLAASVSGYALLLDLGIGATLVRIVAERLAADDPQSLGKVIASAAAFFLVVGIIAALVLLGIGVVAGTLFSVTPKQASLLSQLLVIGALLQVWYWPASTASQALAGFQRYDLVSRTTVVSSLAGIAAIAATLILEKGPVFLTVLNALIAVGASLVNMWILWRIVPRQAARPRPSIATIREMLRSGVPIFVVQIAQVVSRQHTDRLVLGVFVGPAAVGLYEIAAKLSALVTQLSDLVVSAVLPVAAGLNARGRHESMRALFLRGSRYTAILIAPVVVIVAVIARPFIANWFGPGYMGSVPVAQLLVLAQILVPLYLIGDPILVGKDRYRLWMPKALWLAALNLILSVIFVQRWGLIGVAFGTAVATWVEFPLYGRMILKDVGVAWSDWLRTAMWPTYGLLIVPAALSALAITTRVGSSMLGLAVLGAVAIGAYWLLAGRFVLSAEERTALVGMGRGALWTRGDDGSVQ